MADNWDLKDTKQVPVLTEQMINESKWWADNRFATVKEEYPVDKTAPFKKMTKQGLEALIASLATNEETERRIKEARAKAIERYKNTVFDRKDIELNFGVSERYPNEMWQAYLYYSEEQHTIQSSEYADEKQKEKELRDHIRQHGQLVKNG